MNADNEFEFEEFDYPAEFENDEELSRFGRMPARSRFSASRPIHATVQRAACWCAASTTCATAPAKVSASYHWSPHLPLRAGIAGSE